MLKEISFTAEAELGISLTCCGYDDICGGETVLNAGGCCVVFVSDGTGTLTCLNKVFPLGKGDYFVLRGAFSEGRLASFNSERLSFCKMEFCGRDAGEYLSRAGVPTDLAVSHTDSPGFRSAVMNCIDYAESDREEPSQLKLSAFLFEALYSLMPTKKNRRRRASEQTQRALRFIENNYMHGISARDIALQLNIDRTHFFRIFKAKTGVSPERYIMNLRVSKACELLKNKGCTVTEAASLVGVNDVCYFSKLFKKITGQSPTEYRKTRLS